MRLPLLDLTPSGAALGATVNGLDLRDEFDAATVAAIRAALLQHEVLFFPQQQITADDHIRFARLFGELQPHAVLDTVGDHPDIVVFDTAQRATTAEWWHTDMTCDPRPPMGSILQIVIAPERGGATHWASMTAAYDSLDDATKARLALLTALHRSWWQPVQESIHPVVRVHPESGNKALFVNGIFTKQIIGLPEDESTALLAELTAHATRSEFTVRHDWQSGDIAFWDNRCTQHRVDNDFGSARRRGHRITIQGDAPHAA